MTAFYAGLLTFAAWTVLGREAHGLDRGYGPHESAQWIWAALLVAGHAATVLPLALLALTRRARIEQEVERRVAARSAALEAERTRRESVLRHNLLADLHDGVGACLIGLLRHVQSGAAGRSSIERRVEEALREMRMTIDALHPPEGDLAAVLGGLRHRLDEMIGEAGMRLHWDVEEIPRIAHLEPTMVYALQRLLLEAVANAVKHSGARNLAISAAGDGAHVLVSVTDDGCGFDPGRRTAGMGLMNMRARALQLGARLELRSSHGHGTAVRFSIPLSLP